MFIVSAAWSNNIDTSVTAVAEVKPLFHNFGSPGEFLINLIVVDISVW